MPHDDGELEVHVTFYSNKKSGRSEIDEIVIKRPSNPTETEAKLIAAAKFRDSWNDDLDGGLRWMAPMWLYGYWVVKARSRHTDSSAVLHHLLRGNDFKSVLKNHMTWAIKHFEKTYHGRAAVPPLPVDEQEKDPKLSSDQEDGDSMRTAEKSFNTSFDARTTDTSSGNSGQPSDSTHTEDSVPQQK
ncbi:hypothetical protein FFLO_06306 [Filobasidium floriforme]|uniref:Uncharacterized protein n=1 Tax=Filobasidium floriforme TaxID=5210 RepID=A0A8K0JKS5_9TREE|nr:hypothetical protein FFLO_06306 [Filobasidium floriforme]